MGELRSVHLLSLGGRATDPVTPVAQINETRRHTQWPLSSYKPDTVTSLLEVVEETRRQMFKPCDVTILTRRHHEQQWRLWYRPDSLKRLMPEADCQCSRPPWSSGKFSFYSPPPHPSHYPPSPPHHLSIDHIVLPRRRMLGAVQFSDAVTRL